MLAWLTRLLKAKHPLKTKREIFEYFDGSETRLADPLVIKRKLDEKGGEDWPKLFDVFKIPTVIGGTEIGGNLVKELAKKQEDTKTDIIEMVRYAFEVKPFSYANHIHEGVFQRVKEGLTELQTLELLTKYIQWFSEAMAEILPLSTASMSSGLERSGRNQLTSNSVELPSVVPSSGSVG